MLHRPQVHDASNLGSGFYLKASLKSLNQAHGLACGLVQHFTHLLKTSTAPRMLSTRHTVHQSHALSFERCEVDVTGPEAADSSNAGAHEIAGSQVRVQHCKPDQRKYTDTMRNRLQNLYRHRPWRKSCTKVGTCALKMLLPRVLAVEHLTRLA
jgi:hypothetical protein